ncbi:hypothetical protein [Streptomyces flavidovirens]|uniref:hypothetical protein n=1 Tax=Streptomyces flavidovirens TaxID=67298 RepID=UPI000490FCE0|nr:hypothetical protein [Streptomyces flavidovirens]
MEKLAETSPLAALRAARRLEVTAVEVGYWAAHEARKEANLEQAAATFGMNEDAARKLMARFGGRGPYR